MTIPNNTIESDPKGTAKPASMGSSDQGQESIFSRKYMLWFVLCIAGATFLLLSGRYILALLTGAGIGLKPILQVIQRNRKKDDLVASSEQVRDREILKINQHRDLMLDQSAKKENEDAKLNGTHPHDLTRQLDQSESEFRSLPSDLPR